MIYQIIGSLLFLGIFIFIYSTQPKDNRISFMMCLVGMFLGAVPCFFASFFFQLFVSATITRFIENVLIRNLIEYFLIVAFSEEMMVFIASSILVKKKATLRIHYIVIFAAVGTGFELFESFFQMNDLLSLIVRCVLALHISLEIIMGNLYAKKKKVLALIIPVLIHGMYDFLLSYGGVILVQSGNNTDESMNGLLCMSVAVIIGISLFIYSLKLVVNIKKENNNLIQN